MVIDILVVSLVVFSIIIAYKLLLKWLSKGRIDSEKYCVLYSTESFQVNGEVEFYFQCPKAMHVDFKIWTLEEKETIIASRDFDLGGHIIRYDTNSLSNGIYLFGIETESQKTVKKFEIKN